MVKDHLLLPLNDLLAEYGPTLLRENEHLLAACAVNDKIYAVPAGPLAASSIGFVYNTDLAEEYGIVFSDHPDMEEFEQAAEILKAHGKYLLYPSNSLDTAKSITALFPSITPVMDSSYYYGVFVGNSDTPVVKNLYETQEYLDYCHLLRKWNENGWIPENYLTSGSNSALQFRQGNVLMTWSGASPLEYALQSSNYPFSIKMVMTKQTGLTTSSVLENGWGISETSENPQKAMEFLNYLYENEVIANLLMNGIEGQEYKKLSEHIITFCDGETAADLKYKRVFTLFGDYRKVYKWSPLTENDYEDLQKYYLTSYVSNYLGYVFHPDSVSAEVSAVQKILSDYQPALECGLLEDVPSAVQALNEKLRQAGIDRIIAENQRQLDEWMQERVPS